MLLIFGAVKRRDSLSNGGVIHFESREIQVKVRHDMPVRAKVIVRSTEDGTLRILHRTRLGVEHELTWADYRKPAPPVKREGLTEKQIAMHKARHPKANHPWRSGNYVEQKAAFDERRGSSTISDCNPLKREIKRPKPKVTFLSA